jgi:hypothetical protein
LFKEEESTQKLIEKYKPDNPRVKIPNNKKRLRIYTALLEGIIIQLDEVCRAEGSSELLMISDRLDEGIHKEAIQALDHLKQEINIQPVSGCDNETKEIVHGKIETRVEGFNTAVRYIADIKTEQTPSCLTIVADVISNTLFRHLRCVVESNPGICLHSQAAISDFHLANRIKLIE